MMMMNECFLYSPPNPHTPDPHMDGVAHAAAFYGDIEKIQELFKENRGLSFKPLGDLQATPLVSDMKL